MFITAKRKQLWWEYEIKDDKSLLLHYFQKELDTLAIQTPVKMFIHINPDDRKGYRIKLVKLFKMINKKASYECYLLNSNDLEVLKEYES